jgi:serine/threonine protein kinase
MASKPETVGAGRWSLTKRLGAGSFGEIYMAEDRSSSIKVAVKLEDTVTKSPQLLAEAKILRSLRDLPSLPRVIWYGTEGQFNILVMTLLGQSLEEILNAAGRQLSLRGTMQVAEEMLQRVEDVHAKDVIHRDIKPENFLVGRNTEARNLYIIDFGLAKRYRDVRTGMHIPYKEEKSLTGTARYASLNTHLGLEQSRRDDLEALGYIFVYLQRGKLPWQGLPKSSHKDQYRGIMEVKMRTALPALCQDLQPEFCSFLQYCRMLKFEEAPDYTYLKRLLKTICSNNSITTFGKLDWEVDMSEVRSSSSGSKKRRQRRKSISTRRKSVAMMEKRKISKTQGEKSNSTATKVAVGPRLSPEARARVEQCGRNCPNIVGKGSKCTLF